jgi:hypothetical protein
MGQLTRQIFSLNSRKSRSEQEGVISTVLKPLAFNRIQGQNGFLGAALTRNAALWSHA